MVFQGNGGGADVWGATEQDEPDVGLYECVGDTTGLLPCGDYEPLRKNDERSVSGDSGDSAEAGVATDIIAQSNRAQRDDGDVHGSGDQRDSADVSMGVER